jgi:hypothetical protein
MQNYPNHRLLNLANFSPDDILRRLRNLSREIFGEFNVADYLNLVDGFHRLRYDARLNEDNAEDLRGLIGNGIDEIAQRYERGEEIHPGTLNIVVMAIHAHNQASEHPYQFGAVIQGISPQTEEFMEEIVLPITRNLQMFNLHHAAPWVNPVHVAREAARRAAEEAPGLETRIARTLPEFRAMRGHAMEAECPLCLEAFIEHPEDIKHSREMRRSPVFMPVVFHKDAKGKWFHPMHTVCVNDVKGNKCPMCREKVTWPKMMAVRKTRRPNSSPTRKRSLTKRRSPGRSRSPGNRRTPNSAGF